MYSLGGWLDWLRVDRRPVGGTADRRIPANVFLLGLTSLFTDISSEMVVSVLPIYLVGFLRMTPAQFGLVDGLYQGVAGVVQLGSAVITDRIRRYKEMAALGYGFSVLCRVGLLATRAWTGLTAFLVLDRLGKGMRSAPRDALISLSVPRDRLGTAFGVHRAMDAVGAMLGPVVAFVILRGIANGFDVVFLVSLCVAIIGFAVLWLFVDNRPAGMVVRDERTKPTLHDAIRLLSASEFRHLAIAAFLLGAMTISDSFIYLTLQRRTAMSSGAFPLLYVLTSAGYLVFAIPMGRLADRVGRFPVFVAGHAVLVALYAALIAFPAGSALLGLVVAMLAIYYASTEGVLMALGSALLPEHFRTSGLAVLTTLLAIARFAGSAAFGIVWAGFGVDTAVIAFLIGLVFAICLVVTSRPKEPASI
jgi:MFS family permease